MADTFEGAPDARQEGDITPSRFRPRYRALTEDEKELHDTIKELAEFLEGAYGDITPCRETSIALTKLEESVMWAIKGLTA